MNFLKGAELSLMGLELLLDLGCPYQEFSCCAVDLSLHVELIALDLESCGTIVRL